MTKLNRGVAVGIALMLALAASARAQVMEQVPASALMVFKVNNLKAFNAKVAKLAQDLGVAAMLPAATDPLAFLQVQMKMQQGVDLNGELAFAVLHTATGDEPVILIPTTDMKSFLANWPQSKSDGTVTEIMLGGTERSYLAFWGKYAAITPTKEVLTNRPAGAITVPAGVASELASKDAVLFANMAAIRTNYGPLIASSRQEVLQALKQNLAREPQAAKFAVLIDAVVNQVFNGVDHLMNETDGATIALNLTPAGINLSYMAEFQSSSYLGQIASSLKNTDAPLLVGLPKAKYLAYVGASVDPAVRSKIVADMVDPIVAKAIAAQPEMTALKEYADAFKEVIGGSNASAVGWIAPQGALGTESLLQVVGVEKGDPKAIAAGYTHLLAAQEKLMTSLSLQGANMIKQTHTPNAKTLDGVSFDQVVVKIDPNAQQNPQAMQQMQILNLIYGPQGGVSNYGAVGDHFIMGTGVNDAVLSATIAAVKAQESNIEGNENVKVVSAELPKQRVEVGYLAVGDLVSTVLTYAKQFGLAIPVMLPPDLPPVGMAISSAGTSLRMDIHVPTALVQSLTAAALQAQMQMQGGGGPPGAAPGGGL